MKIEFLKLVCFSPTGTTRTIIQGIGRGINQNTTELIDITKPTARKQRIELFKNELLVIAVPVYMGRVPALLNEWLHTIKAHDTPVVCVVVYGNREYDNALLELKNIMIECGCKPIACAAYIGEHSFSCTAAPTAEGRPDAKDLTHAESFGRKIIEKMRTINSIDHIPNLNVPGEYPYEGVTKLWNVDFITVSDKCNQCGICSEKCPVGAIDSEKSYLIDKEKCITCCACIKNCPQNARTIKASPVKDASIRLNRLYGKRKEPVFFL